MRKHSRPLMEPQSQLSLSSDVSGTKRVHLDCMYVQWLVASRRPTNIKRPLNIRSNICFPAAKHPAKHPRPA